MNQPSDNQPLEELAGYAETNEMIEAIGAARRELDKLTAEFNDDLAALKKRFEQAAEGPRAAEAACLKLVRQWCNHHRRYLTGSVRKSYKFPAGAVAWRDRPPHVALPKRRMLPGLIAWLAEHGPARFLREVKEINKEQMLHDPAEAAKLERFGVSIRSGGETFEVKPIEMQLAEGVPEEELPS